MEVYVTYSNVKRMYKDYQKKTYASLLCVLYMYSCGILSMLLGHNRKIYNTDLKMSVEQNIIIKATLILCVYMDYSLSAWICKELTNWQLGILQKHYRNCLGLRLMLSLGLGCHCYADDTQLYVSFRPDAQEQSISNLEACVDYIRGWMLQNRLMLNDSKTELMIIGTPKQTSKLNLNGITVGNSVIKPSVNARNLGVQLDTHLNMEYHITNTCKSAYHMIYNLRRIRKFLDKGSTKTIVHACITSKLDYCNGLLYGIPDSQIGRLQRVQNTCARLICGCSKFSRITPLLRDLHWLPVRQRISFKILLIVYKALLGQTPTYISELLKFKPNKHTHNLRSSLDTLLLQIPSYKTKTTLGDRAFACAAPKLWNNLPLEIRKSPSLNVFKSKLKAHLFI